MLSTNLNCPAELMNIALQAERESIRRYSLLALQMREVNNVSAARLFERIVDEEREHEHFLLQWMAKEGIPEVESISPIKWSELHISTPYNDEACNSYYTTPYRALAFAVHNEEIAFAFYSHVAAQSQNKTVRQHAKILAREELGHAALLRVERRKAFHEERGNHQQEPKLDTATITKKIDLLTAALHIDHYLLEQMLAIKESTSEVNPPLNALIIETQQQIKENETSLEEQKNSFQLIAGETITANLKKLKQYNIYVQQKFNHPDKNISQLCACCDRSFAFYDSIVKSAYDEQLILTAQHLTSVSLDRISALKSALTYN